MQRWYRVIGSVSYIIEHYNYGIKLSEVDEKMSGAICGSNGMCPYNPCPNWPRCCHATTKHRKLKLKAECVYCGAPMKSEKGVWKVVSEEQ